MSIGAQSSDSRQRPVFTSTGGSYLTTDTGYDGGGKNTRMFSQSIRDQPDPISRALFGGGKGDEQSTFGQRLVLDPSIAAAENQALAGMGKAYGEYGGQLSQLRESAYGNLPDYISSLTNPIKAQQAQQMGGLQQGLTQRGLGGSSFYGQAIGGLGADQSRALTDATAQATMYGAQGIAGLSRQEAEAAKTLEEFRAAMAQQKAMRDIGILTNLGQESASFGLNVGIGGGKGGGSAGGSPR